MKVDIPQAISTPPYGASSISSDTGPGWRREMTFFCCMVFLACVLLVIAPVLADTGSAGYKYMSGSPALSASISGTNQFDPGDDFNLPVVIANNGVNQFKFVQSGIIDTEDLSNTAKQLTVGLNASGAPLTIKSDPQEVGDLLAGGSTTATFHIKINQDAPAGTYVLPVSLNYTYLYQAEQYGDQTIQYYYRTVNTSVTLPITIKSEVQINVLSVNTDNLNAGIEGYITLNVQNTGYEDGQNAVIVIQQNGQSPIMPTQGSVFIGDFPVGAVEECQFKAMVSSTAEPKTYPLDVLVYYKNSEGDYVYSETETVGVPVGGKVSFNVTSVKTEIWPGRDTVIQVEYQNTGGTTAYDAQAQISAVDPFTSDDDTSYLGTMAPGDSRTAAFDVALDKSATVKVYGLDSDVQYRDVLDNTFTSDPVKVQVQVVPQPGITDMLGLPGIIAIILVVLASAGYLIYTKRFKHH
jgi:hypothetical protein